MDPTGRKILKTGAAATVVAAASGVFAQQATSGETGKFYVRGPVRILSLPLTRSGPREPGANSSGRIDRACSPSISSPWRRSGCNGSTCSSSSS
jgi:hypothetical protein